MSVTRILQRVSGAKLFIGGKEVSGSFGGAIYEHEPAQADESEPMPVQKVSFTMTSSFPMTSEARVFFDGLFPKGSRRMERIRSRYARKRTGPYFCARCLAIGRARPILTLYGLRMHLAQERHGHRGFLRAEVRR